MPTRRDSLAAPRAVPGLRHQPATTAPPVARPRRERPAEPIDDDLSPVGRARAERPRTVGARPRRRPPGHHRVAAVPRARLLAILAVVVVVYGAFGLRLVELQAGEGGHYQRLGLDQRVQTVELPAERGGIFDRNGNDLAVSVGRSSVWADPRLISDPDAYAAQLAPIVGADPVELAARIGQKNR